MDNTELLKKLQEEFDRREAKRREPCPSCGRCPECGRSNAPQLAPYPMPSWPRYPYYWGTAPTFDHLYWPGTINATNTTALTTYAYNATS